MIVEIVLIISSYLLGSLCFGYILAKLLKKDNFGKKDLPGAAGSFRQFGPLFGISVGMLDIVKGAIPILIAKILGMGYPIIILSAMAVVAGHSWPLFFKFNGGGGLAPTMGVLLCLMPKEFAVAMTAAIASGYAYRHSIYNRIKIPPIPVGASIGFILLPLLAWYSGRANQLILLSLLLFLVAGIRAIHLSVRQEK
jgi:acyl-phosphate glycerol 3-phosphate acyltransferase